VNPYEVLGVDQAASPEVVRRAYRKRAKKAHPDGGGTAKAFDELRRSMIVLSDPARKEKYDRTGEVDSESVDNTLGQAISRIVDVVIRAATKMANVGQVDLIKETRTYFLQEKVNFEDESKRIAKAAQAVRKVAERLGGKGRSELVKRAVEQHAQQMMEPVSRINEQIEVCKIALTILDECTFKRDMAPMAATGGMWLNMTATA
jgi:curved DNA-binding protein CbpA